MNVCPMKSGTIVQSRAQVFTGSRLPVCCCFSIFASRRSLTYGPFFMERPIHFPRYPDCLLYKTIANRLVQNVENLLAGRASDGRLAGLRRWRVRLTGLLALRVMRPRTTPADARLVRRLSAVAGFAALRQHTR